MRGVIPRRMLSTSTPRKPSSSSMPWSTSSGSLAALFPWSLIAAAGWGIGLGVHGLNHRAWLADNRVAVDRALTRVDAWQTTGPALPAPDPAAQVDLSPPSPAAAAPPTTPRSSAPGIDPEWKALIARGEDAVRRARAALGEHAGGDPRGVHARLGGGLSDVEGLAMSATRLRLALDHVGSGGGDELASRIAELDRRVAGADDPRLARVYESNRGLLVARRTKIRTIEAELERVRASAEGFVLAAENLQLDAARLGAGHLGDVGDALFEPLERLGEEVEILRQVEVELEAL